VGGANCCFACFTTTQTSSRQPFARQAQTDATSDNGSHGVSQRMRQARKMIYTAWGKDGRANTLIGDKGPPQLQEEDNSEPIWTIEADSRRMRWWCGSPLSAPRRTYDLGLKVVGAFDAIITVRLQTTAFETCVPSRMGKDHCDRVSRSARHHRVQPGRHA